MDLKHWFSENCGICLRILTQISVKVGVRIKPVTVVFWPIQVQPSNVAIWNFRVGKKLVIPFTHKV